MYKKIFLLVLFSFFPLKAALLSKTLTEASTHQSGFRIGLHTGMVLTHQKMTGAFDTANPVLGIFSDSVKETSGFPLLGGMLGYRYIFSSNFTLGAEIIANYYPSQRMKKTLAQQGIPFDFNYQRTYSIIPTLNVGWRFMPTFHASIGLGLGISNFRYELTNVSTNIFLKTTKRKYGFVPSLAVDWVIAPRWSLVGGVACEIYKKFNHNFGSAISTSFNNSSYHTLIKSRIWTARIGLVYRI